MPIQELLTGVTFTSPVTNINTIPTPTQYFGSLLQLWLAANLGVTPTAGTPVAVTASAIASNVGTLTVPVSSNFAIGQSVTLAGLTNATALNGTFTVLALPTGTTLTVPVTSANVTSASEASATCTGSVATVWADQSGLGRNLVVNAGATTNPAIVSSAQNGLPGLQSTGISNISSAFLRSPFVSALDFQWSSPFSVVMAYKPGNNAFSAYDGEIGNFQYNSGTCVGWLVGTNSLKPNLRLISTRGTAECSVSTSAALTAGTTYIVQLVNTGTGVASGLQIYVNGVLQTLTTLFDNLGAANTQTGVNGVAAPSAGTNTYGPGRSTILEAFIVSKAFTTRDASIVDAYLNQKWAIH
jgi:hypothetical protein